MTKSVAECFQSPAVMGVLNVTPDSFSDGGQFHNGKSVARSMLLEKASGMIKAGAAFLDVGGESTRPGADPVSIQEELDRVVPIVELLKKEFNVQVSVDTSTPEVIQSAAAVGADLINDVRALEREGALLAAVKSGLPVCLMHMQGTPQNMQDSPAYRDVVQEVKEYLLDRIDVCLTAGIAKNQIMIDPGFGFGKTLAHNFQLLSRLDEFKTLGFPLLVGMSRKSMIGNVLNKPVDQRLSGSLALATIAALKGADVIRVHDVEETVDAIKMVTAMRTLSEDV